MMGRHGSVSDPVAAAMAEGMRKVTDADVALSVTGIAGPTGGSEARPVGLVYIALACDDGTEVQRHQFRGTRERIRVRTALTALDMLRMWAKGSRNSKLETQR
jgi:PncC family amidohydrolase